MKLDEAARLLNVSEATLRRWVRQGLLTPADGTGARFERAELERWARRRGLALGRGDGRAMMSELSASPRGAC